MPKFNVKLKDRQEITRDTYLFRLEKPTKLKFAAGQYFYVKLIDPPQDDPKSNMRHFSFASAPGDDFIEFATRDTGSVFKQTLKKMEIGHEVEIKDPDGHFTLAKQSSAVSFLVGGIGITPIRSILRDKKSAPLDFPVTLFFSNRNPKSAPFLKELSDLQIDKFTMVPTMT